MLVWVLYWAMDSDRWAHLHQLPVASVRECSGPMRGVIRANAWWGPTGNA